MIFERLFSPLSLNLWLSVAPRLWLQISPHNQSCQLEEGESVPVSPSWGRCVPLGSVLWNPCNISTISNFKMPPIFWVWLFIPTAQVKWLIIPVHVRFGCDLFLHPWFERNSQLFFYTTCNFCCVERRYLNHHVCDCGATIFLVCTHCVCF